MKQHPGSFNIQMRKSGSQWSSSIQFIDLYHQAQASRVGLIQGTLDSKWAAKWKATGIFQNDPLYENWWDAVFIRKDNENHFSDYLAWLIENSRFGLFSAHLFKNIPGTFFGAFTQSGFAFPQPQYLQQHVKRERPEYLVDLTGHYRTDLQIDWVNGYTTQIEVKTGDPHLSKTFGHVRQTRENHHHQKGKWNHLILILDRQINDWKTTANAERAADDPEIHLLLWSDIAVALRKSLTDPQILQEKATWLWAAYAFLGVVEQVLCDLPVLPLHDPNQYIDTQLFQKILSGANDDE